MKLFREPLLHFVLIAALVLTVEALRGPETAEGEPTIVLSLQTQDRLRLTLTESLGREPTAEEVDAAFQDWVDTEVLVREAKAIGLDDHDPVVRGRLARQMAFVQQASTFEEPDESLLLTLYEQQDLRSEPRVTLRQIDTTDPDHAATLATSWREGDDPTTLDGVDAPGGPVLKDRSPDGLETLYGPDFAHAVASLEIGVIAVLESDQGWHVVMVERRVDIMTALTTSVKAVYANAKAMLVWGSIICLLVALSIATMGFGFIVTMPLLAFASWHAYIAVIKTKRPRRYR